MERANVLLSMGGEIITLQAGQCGNHVGKFLWSQLAKEHAIGTDGLSQLPDSSAEREDDTKPFFRENSRNRFTPRAILLDSEPSVIADMENTFRGFSILETLGWLLTVPAPVILGPTGTI